MQEVPLLALHLLKFCTEDVTHVLQIVTYAAVKNGMENKSKLQ